VTTRSVTARTDVAPSTWVVVSAGIALGLAAEAASLGLGDPVGWIPDLVVGWACIGIGLLTASRAPHSRVGWLLVGTGGAWFIGNFGNVPVEPVAIVAVQFTLLYRAILVHAALTLSGGRTGGWHQRGAIVASYIAWSIPATADSILATGSVSAVVIAAAVVDLLRAPVPARRTRVAALAAVALLGGAFTLATTVHVAMPDGGADWVVLRLNEVAVLVVAAELAVFTLLPGLEAGRVTDLVVEAAWRHSDRVDDGLARAIGDPSLRVGYWHRGSGAYLDASGEPVEPPPPGDRRILTRVDVDGLPTAIIVHDPAVLESSALLGAVQVTTRLAAANARLRGDVLDQLAEVRASRGRLLRATDAERDRLERRLEEGPMRRLRALDPALEAVVSAADARGEPDVTEAIDHARAALGVVGEDLGRLAHGLHPALVGSMGLAAALRFLVARSPLAAEAVCETDRLPGSVELAIYYASAEAIANAAKHAQASAVSVRVASDRSRVTLTVVDDGVGGADPSAGTGLQGIVDRISALGGHVAISSEAGSGTSLRAEIPLARAPER
jgi:signal transduction histidine kinase